MNETKPRILMLTNSVYSRDIRVRRYAEYLVNDGYLVDIICLATEDGAPQSSDDRIGVFPLPMTRKRQEKIRHLIDWGLSILFMFWYVNKLDFHNRYNLIHVHNMPDILVFCATIQRIKGTPIILNIHDATPELAQSKLGIGPNHPIIKIQSFLEKVCVGFSAHVITATESFKNKLIERGTPEKKITVITNFPDERMFTSREALRIREDKDGQFVLLYVGTVAFRYGLQTVVGALPVLRERIPGLKLQVFTKIKGEGKALSDCVQLAQDLGVADIFEVNDPVPLEKMPFLMANADIGLYPALKDCHMDNALSLKIPEMVNMELPIVASRISVLEHLYGPDSIAFVESGDVADFSRMVVELYESPEKRRCYASNAKAKGSKMLWRDQYPIYRKLVEKLMSRD